MIPLNFSILNKKINRFDMYVYFNYFSLTAFEFYTGVDRFYLIPSCNICAQKNILGLSFFSISDRRGKKENSGENTRMDKEDSGEE